jgi:hypothetical protein
VARGIARTFQASPNPGVAGKEVLSDAHAELVQDERDLTQLLPRPLRASQTEANLDGTSAGVPQTQ